MSEDPVIDVGEFARSEGRLAGKLATASLSRLADLLAKVGGAVTYHVAGRIDGDGIPRLEIDVSARLVLRCQRCLDPVPMTVAARRELRFVADASELAEVADEAQEVDDLPMPASMRVSDWVEEEILLALPFSPRHEEGSCHLPPNPAAEPGQLVKPFARLFGLDRGQIKDQ